ncbi:MAG: hypothetical protein ACRCTG_11185 [Aestuariivirga sp.]
MARTTIAVQVPKGPYPTLQPAADALDMTLTACDTVNKNQTPLSGNLLLVAQNSHATNAYTITVTSVVDARNRVGDITTYSLAAGDVAMFWINQAEGWLQADGNLYYEGSNAAIKFALLKL